MIEIDMEALGEAVDRAFNTAPEQLEKLLRRIRKALAIAEDPRAGEHERNLAKDMYAALMARYGITAAMLADSGQLVDKVGDDEFVVDLPYTYDKVNLLTTVVRAYGGELVYKRKDQRRSVMHVFGMGSDLERIKLLWGSLLVQLRNEMAAASAARPAGVHKGVFERSFVLGFSTEVGERIRAAEKKAKAGAEAERVEADTAGTGKSVALVLAGRRDVVQNAVKAAYPKLRNERRSGRKLSTDGLAAGAAAGRRADLAGGDRLSGAAGRSSLGS